MVSEVSPVMAVVAYSDVCSHLGGSERRELRWEPEMNITLEPCFQKPTSSSSITVPDAPKQGTNWEPNVQT